MNGDEPTLVPSTTTPRIMLTRKACTVANTASTGASHCLLKRMMARPITTCQNIQSRKLPSCASQKQEIMYCTGRWLLECAQA